MGILHVWDSLMDADFEKLVDRFRDGDEEAARELVDRYSPQMAATIRCFMSSGSRLRREFSTVDLLQSVWRVFYAHHKRDFQKPEELARYLKALSRNRVLRAGRDANAQKRSMSRTVSLLEPVSAKEHDPSDDVEARDFVASQNPHHRMLVNLRLYGHSWPEIADIMGVSERQVFRILKQVRESCRNS